jgi:peptidyl-prolyl cis-trans isomerase B (cyclophilin B)
MKTMNAKNICMILLILSLSIVGLVGCNKDNPSKEVEDAKEEANSGSKSNFTATHQIEIEVENYGTIYVGLDEESAPITVNNFIKLAEEGFYDGLTFHRIISGFMIQGGDPLGNGTGGSNEKIKGEFAENGIENTLSHTRGAISMARSNDYNSASSQFFIVHEDSTFLNGSYAAFGYVTDGMDIVDKICSETPIQDKNGTVLHDDQPVIKSIKVIK